MNIIDKILNTINNINNMDSINTFSDLEKYSSNYVADKDIFSDVNKGLDGLGALNDGIKTQGVLETPGEFLSKVDSDTRKLATYFNKFNTARDYKNYLFNYFKGIDFLEVRETGNFEDALEVEFKNGSSMYVYTVIAVLDYAELMSLINKLKTYVIDFQPNEKLVAIGYFRYDIHLKAESGHLNLELLGADEIIDINTAIDLSDKNLPYASIGNKHTLCFNLANNLNLKYRTNLSKSNYIEQSEEFNNINKEKQVNKVNLTKTEVHKENAVNLSKMDVIQSGNRQ